MKISQKQASLLAREIVKLLQAKKVQRLPEITRAKIQDWADKRDEFKKKEKEMQEIMQAHENKLWAIIGIKRLETSIRTYNTVSQIIEGVEKKQIPSQQEIEDEIILKSMFDDAEDMEKFVQSIVCKYEKKLQQKISSN